MRVERVIAVVTGIAAASRGLAIQGCLTPEEDLARRADVVVVGTIENIETATLPACPELVSTEGRVYPQAYPRCGQILGFVVRTETRLRGSTPQTMVVRVPLPQFGFMSLTCDDRPAPEAMKGLHAIFFLERSGDQLWLVDGPDGIYSSRTPVSPAQVARVAGILNTVKRGSER